VPWRGMELADDGSINGGHTEPLLLSREVEA
jgi:hypothetical protein